MENIFYEILFNIRNGIGADMNLCFFYGLL